MIKMLIFRKKFKCTLVQALRLCTGRTAHRGSRRIALLFHDGGTRRRCGVSVTPRPLFTRRERPGTHCTRAWVGPRAGLDRCGKSRSHQDSIPGPSIPYPVALPTELPGPLSTATIILISFFLYTYITDVFSLNMILKKSKHVEVLKFCVHIWLLYIAVIQCTEMDTKINIIKCHNITFCRLFACC
jgi:hypothetical protein